MSNSNYLSRGNLRFTVIVALFAMIFGRALEQALPGSHSGLGRWLDVSRWSAGFSSQLLALLIVMSAGRLTWLTWLDRRVSYRHRFMAAPSASVVIFLVISASFDFLISPYTPEISLLMGVAGTIVAIYAATVCLGPPVMRATGIVLALVAAASVAQVTARLLALQASDAALHTQYAVSRWIATATTMLDAASLVAVVVWGTSRNRSGRAVLLAVFFLAGLLAWAARRGTSVHADFFEVLMSRMLAQLHREPSSFVPRVVHDVQDVFAFLMATWLLWRPRSVLPELRSCLAMVLLARSSPDIPLCSGLLVTGSLGLSLMAAEWRNPSADLDSKTAV